MAMKGFEIMILSFKQQFPWGTPTNFESKILSGIKKHSIREDKHRRWKAGRKMINYDDLTEADYETIRRIVDSIHPKPDERLGLENGLVAAHLGGDLDIHHLEKLDDDKKPWVVRAINKFTDRETGDLNYLAAIIHFFPS